MKKIKIKYAFFDCWDTVIKYSNGEKDLKSKIIYDHIIDKKISFEEFDKYYVDFLHYYHLNTLFEVREEDLFRYLLTSLGLKVDVDFTTLCEIAKDGWNPSSMEGLRELLDFFKSKGVRCSIISNTIQTEEQTRYYIRKFFNDDDFEKVIVSSDYAVKKPNHLFFELGAKLCDVDPANCLYFGDRFRADVYGSSSANMNPIWINHNNKKVIASLEVKSYDEFKNYKEALDFFKKGEKYEF